jgi:hypothetical protein
MSRRRCHSRGSRRGDRPRRALIACPTRRSPSAVCSPPRRRAAATAARCRSLLVMILNPFAPSWRAHGRKRERPGAREKALVRKSKLVRLWLLASPPLGALRCDSGRRPGLGRRASASPMLLLSPRRRLWRCYGGCGTMLTLADEPMGKIRQRASASLRSNRWDTPPPSRVVGTWTEERPPWRPLV